MVGRAKYTEMYQAATGPGTLEIFEWVGHDVLANGEGQNHSKYLIADGKAVIVGSFNLDPRSRYLNTESVVVLENASEAAKYTAAFNEGLTTAYSLYVSPEQAKELGVPKDLEDQFKLELLKILNPLL